MVLILPDPGRTDAAPLRGTVKVSTEGGYARLMFRFADEDEAAIQVANGILIISFKKPVSVEVDRIASSAADYISAARLDPDGTAIRIALTRKLTANSMAAGESLLVDLLPETWKGLPPGLPQQVIDELAERARKAERKARRQAQIERERATIPIRVRVGTQPTFTRYVFELPELVDIASDRSPDRLALRFDGSMKFDLADALAMLPPTVASIAVRPGDAATIVMFQLIGKPDVRTFREDTNFVVDVEPLGKVASGRNWLAEASKAVDPPANAAASSGKPAVAAPNPAAVALEKPPARAPNAVGAAAVPLPLPRPADWSSPKTQHVDGGATARDQATGDPPKKPDPATEAPAPQPAAPPPVAAAAPSVSQSAEQSPDPAARSGPADKVAPKDNAPVETASQPEPSPTRDVNAPVVVQVKQQGDTLHLEFPFAAQTAAAVFMRADTLWVVFDSTVPIDIATLVAQPIGFVRSAAVTRSAAGQAVQIKLDRPKLTTLEANGSTWAVTIGDEVLGPISPLSLGRARAGPGRTEAVIPFQAPRPPVRLSDPEVGDTLLVVTAFGPTRGFVRTQNFVEFRVLASTHGIVVQPLADDLRVESLPDKVVIGRPPGLIMSAASGLQSGSEQGQPSYRPFDPQVWGFDAEANFRERERELVRRASEAAEKALPAARLDLARFYLAQTCLPKPKACSTS
jgi:hypothetical protein